MVANKIILNGNTILDLSGDNVTESDVAVGKKFHKANGEGAIGTGTFGSSVPSWDKDYLIEGEPTEDSGDISINGVIREYEVNAGATVNAGDFVEFVNKFGSGQFNSVKSNYISACKLDNNRVLVAYQRSSYGRAIVITIDGTTTTVGMEITFNSATTTYISACALTDSKVLVAYQDGGNLKYGTAVVLTIDGTTITAGTEITFQDTNVDVNYISAVALSDSKALVAYQYHYSASIYYLRACVLTISGTTIARGSFLNVDTDDALYISACALTDSKVLVAYQDREISRYGYAKVLTISGTDITAGTKQIFSAKDETNYISAVALSDSKALVVYQGGVNSSAKVLTIAGTTITVGTEINFEGGSGTLYPSAVALTDSKVLVAYQDFDNSRYGTAIVFTVDGTTITAGTAKVFDYNTTTYPSLVAFSETSTLVAYNNGLSSYSSIEVSGTTITAGGSATVTKVQKSTSNLHNVGVAKTSGAEGEMVEVYCAV
jgi:hypothetical protein